MQTVFPFLNLHINESLFIAQKNSLAKWKQIKA